MIKNLGSYLYTIIFAVLFLILLNLYNKLRKVEIQVLATRELKTVIDNTDIQVNSINKRVDEMDKKYEEMTKIPEPEPVPVHVPAQETFPDLESGNPPDFDFLQQCLNEMLSSAMPSRSFTAPYVPAPNPYVHPAHSQPEIYEYEQAPSRPGLMRQEEFIEQDDEDESIVDLEPEQKANSVDI